MEDCDRKQKTPMKYIKLCFCILLVSVMMMTHSKKSYAQACDTAAAISAAASAMDAAQQAAITAAQTAFEVNVDATITAATTAMQTLIYNNHNLMFRQVLSTWEDRFTEALKAMTAQIYTISTDGTKDLGVQLDARIQVERQRQLQQKEDEARKTFKPSEQVCVADSVNKRKQRANKLAKAVQSGAEKDISELVSNKVGSAAETGVAAEQDQHWTDYADNFCKPTSNKGDANCGAVADPNPNADMDISVTRTFYENDTLDLANPTNVMAVGMLTRNLIGFTPDTPVVAEAIASPEAQDVFLKRRSRYARLNAIASPITSVWADRTPSGEVATEVRDSRLQSGVPAPYVSDTPSKREIQQAFLDQLWDPTFYRDAGDKENTALQKQALLQAYQLMMINELIEKMERIGTVVAVQVGTQLESMPIGSAVGGQGIN